MPRDETYSIIFAALKHPIRRKVLRMLRYTQLSYTQLLKGLDLDTGHLNYYLESLGELVLKSENGNYRLSQTGQAAIALMEKVEDRTTQEKEIAWLKQQKKQKRRSIILLQTFAIIVFLAASLVFFNVAYVTPAPLEISHKNPPNNIIQPDQIISEVDFINNQQFQQNTSTVNRQYIYKLDITTNSTLWVKLLEAQSIMKLNHLKMSAQSQPYFTMTLSTDQSVRCQKQNMNFSFLYRTKT